VLREASSLAMAGHDVTIVARTTDPAATLGDREAGDGFQIVRVPIPPRSRRAWIWLVAPWSLGGSWAAAVRSVPARLPSSLPGGLALLAAGAASLPWVALRLAAHVLGRRSARSRRRSNLDWLAGWRTVVLGWAASAAEVAPSADVYHGHDLTGLEAAGRAWRRHGGTLVYDSHEIFLESGSNAARPRLLKALLARSERRWTRDAAALVTVNESLATELGRRLRPRRTIVVHNAPDHWDPPSPSPDLIRATTGIPASSPIALYHGGFSPDRGLEELAESILQPGMESVHAAYLGYGSMRTTLDAMARAPRFEGRLHVLDAVPPAELLPWVASADVGVMAIQPSTLNHRMSTPNKLFESLAAGLPVVVSDFPEMRAIVLDNPGGPVGEVCDPDDPVDLARAIRAVIDRPAPEVEALRARCLAASHDRWNWEAEVAHLVDLYGAMTTGRP
jgi:glycosyltransferase involved in cell wall biosynthesis